MKRVIVGLLASALAAASAGCDELTAKASGTNSTKAAEKNDPSQKTSVPVTPEALRPPAPTGAADDPRMLTAKESTDHVLRSIRTIRERLTALRENYTAKVASAKDLKAMAEGMSPLVAAARADCDLFLRIAGDLRHEFRYAEDGYAAAARFYRERARAYRDPELVAVNESLASNFDALARDVPRRVRLTKDLIEQLDATKEFLAETDRCLRDSATAFAALAAGPEPVTASPAGRAFKAQFEAFLAVVEDYLNAILAPPAPKPSSPAIPPTPPVAPKPPAAPIERETTPLPPPPTSPPASKPSPPVVITVSPRTAAAVPVRYVTAQPVYQRRPVLRTVFACR